LEIASRTSSLLTAILVSGKIACELPDTVCAQPAAACF
jgi:hypothetical protein